MSCPFHVLCDSCYAGMVDVGEAKAEPIRVPPDHGHLCCSCRVEEGTLPLMAIPGRFPANGIAHPAHPGDAYADEAAKRNFSGKPFPNRASGPQSSEEMARYERELHETFRISIEPTVPTEPYMIKDREEVR